MVSRKKWVAALILGPIAWEHARAQQTELVSVSTTGVQANAFCSVPMGRAISADGRFVVFQSTATNLDPADTFIQEDVFVRDRQSGVTQLVSVAPGGTGGNSHSYYGSISADGRLVGFTSDASDLVPNDVGGWSDAFVRDLVTGTTSLVNVDSNGVQGNNGSGEPSLSADGRYVAFSSGSGNLVPGDVNNASDVFLRDRQTGTTSLVSQSSTGVASNDYSIGPSISADGRWIAFFGRATALVPGDTNDKEDVFVRDALLGTTTRVSVGPAGQQGNDDSGNPAISADGRFVAFSSVATNLVPGDTNGVRDIFVHDRGTGTTSRVSVGPAGAEANLYSYSTTISSDGRFVAFYSHASNLVPNDTSVPDVFVHDRLTRSTELVSLATQGGPGNADSFSATISADGRYVAFTSHASDLVPGDVNGLRDVFLRDRGEPPAVAWCFGDGSGAACPCANAGSSAHGCENSAATGGARLSASGHASLAADTLLLTASGELPSALGIFLQGTQAIAPVAFGDGLRCVGGALSRLYAKNAVTGTAWAPGPGDPSISQRSAALGHPIPLGATRHYQTYYRDPDPLFCPAPAGNAWNVGNALSAVWSP